MNSPADSIFEKVDWHKVQLAILIAGAFFIGWDWGRRQMLTTLKRRMAEGKDARPAADTVSPQPSSADHPA